MFAIIEIVVGLCAIALLFYLFFEFVYPFFSPTKQIGWIFFSKKKQKKEKKRNHNSSSIN